MAVPFSGHGIIAGTFRYGAAIYATAGQIHRIEKYSDQRQKVDIDITNHYDLSYLHCIKYIN